MPSFLMIQWKVKTKKMIKFGSSIFQKIYDKLIYDNVVVVNAKFTFAKSVEM